MPITISDTDPRVVYTATAAQTTFSVPFEFFSETDLTVYKDGVVMTYADPPVGSGQYSVTGAGVSGGGSITFGTGLAGGEIILVVSGAPIQRQTDLPLSGALPIDTLNEQFDRAVSLLLHRRADWKRSLRLGDSDLPYISLNELPTKAVRANKILEFDSDGNPSTTLDATVLQNLQAAAPSQSSGVTYTPGGTGAVDTTVQERLRREIWVEDFGADNTGTTDATTAIQAAIDHAETLYQVNPPKGAVVRLGAGDFKISGALNIGRRYISIIGSGSQTTNIWTSTDGHDMIVVNGNNDPGGFAIGNEIRDLALTWEGGADRTSGWCIKMQDIREPVIMNCNLENGYAGILLESCNRSRVFGNMLDWTSRGSTGGSGIQMQGSAAGTIGQHHVLMNEIRGGNTNWGFADGIYIVAADGCYVNHNHIQGCNNSLRIQPDGTTNNDYIDGIFITGNYFDASYNNDIYLDGAATPFQNILIADCYFRAAGTTGTSAGYGINMVPDVGETVRNVGISNCWFHKIWRDAIRMQSDRVVKSQITNCLFTEGCQSQTATGDIDLDGSGWTLSGNVHQDGDATNANSYALKLAAGCTEIVVDGMNMINNTYQKGIIDNTTGGPVHIRNLVREADVSIIEDVATVQTTDGTATTIFTYTPKSNEICHMEAVVTGAKNNWLQGYIYRCHFGAHNAAGTVAAIANPGANINPEIGGEDVVGATAAWSVSGSNVILQVTGAAGATIEWRASIKITRIR